MQRGGHLRPSADAEMDSRFRGNDGLWDFMEHNKKAGG
jgi:hypothetical protein